MSTHNNCLNGLEMGIKNGIYPFFICPKRPKMQKSRLLQQKRRCCHSSDLTKSFFLAVICIQADKPTMRFDGHLQKTLKKSTGPSIHSRRNSILRFRLSVLCFFTSLTTNPYPFTSHPVFPDFLPRKEPYSIHGIQTKALSGL